MVGEQSLEQPRGRQLLFRGGPNMFTPTCTQHVLNYSLCNNNNTNTESNALTRLASAFVGHCDYAFL